MKGYSFLFGVILLLFRLDNDIESKLAVRLEAAIKSWTAALQGLDEGHDITMDTEDKQAASHKIGGDPKIMRTVHELRMQVS